MGHVDLRDRVRLALRGVAEPTVRRQVEVSREGPGLESGLYLAALEVEKGDEVVARDVDRGLLLVGQHHQTVAGARAEPGDRLGWPRPARRSLPALNAKAA